jgi:molybdopterin/thiamine biosynthesis adenylyltransferase
MLHLDDRALDEILERIKECTSLSNLTVVDLDGSPVQGRGGVIALEGRMQIEGKGVTVQIGLDEDFPLSLPIVILIPGDSLGFIPHVDEDGYICYAQKEGLLLDRHNSALIIEEAIARSASVLTKGVRGESKEDFVEEFEAYWRRLDGAILVWSFVEPGSNLRKIKAARQGKEPYVFLSSEISTTQAYSSDLARATYTYRNALYVPFMEGSYIKPPRYGTFWTVEEIQDIVQQNLSQRNFRKLKRLARKCKYDEVAIFRLPRPSGGVTLFGINFVGVENRHPLLSGGSARQMVPLILKRCDKEYLLPRGGANAQLQRKHVALIGCGSVGGFIALELIRAGVLNLTLVDPDDLDLDNTFRHILGKDAWSQPKVQGIKEEIERKYPYVRIEAITKKVEKALAMGVLKPSSYDLIIIAIGDDTVSLHLNEMLHTHRKAPLVLFTWLEPYGIGGHALLTGNSDQNGCLECLFTPIMDDNEAPLHNRAAFAASGQSFTRDLLGCSNPFTPYGSADALQTALLASRLAVDALLGEINGNPLLSWKGNARDFLQAGFRLSPRYSSTAEELFERRYDYQNPDCPICGLRG